MSERRSAIEHAFEGRTEGASSLEKLQENVQQATETLHVTLEQLGKMQQGIEELEDELEETAKAAGAGNDEARHQYNELSSTIYRMQKSLRVLAEMARRQADYVEELAERIEEIKVLPKAGRA